jgi:hypothetical protein
MKYGYEVIKDHRPVVGSIPGEMVMFHRRKDAMKYIRERFSDGFKIFRGVRTRRYLMVPKVTKMDR